MLPRPPASDTPARITAAITGSRKSEPAVGEKAALAPANSKPAMPAQAPAAVKTPNRVRRSETPRAWAATRFPPTAIVRRPYRVRGSSQPTTRTRKTMGHQMSGRPRK